SREEPAARAQADREFPEVGSVILFPAIDLKEGLAVRLEQGDMARATIFNRDPAAQAHSFEAQGFKYLHIVDLDGAFAGKPVNAAAVERNLDATIALADAVTIPVIASGGLASLDDVRALMAPRASKLAGAIAGRALYDGRLDAAAALALIATTKA